MQFGRWVPAFTFLTGLLLWGAALGGSFLLLLNLSLGVQNWLWVSAPIAWIALWGWRRHRHRRYTRADTTVTARGGRSAMAVEEKVGVVTGYYAKLGVAGIHLTDGPLQVGDRIRVHGHSTDFTQDVESMQVEHVPIQRAEQGAEVAVKVRERVRRNDQILLVRE